MPRSKSSKQWLKEHFSDVYVKRAQQEGYRCRAVYKLIELDSKDSLLKQGMTVVDLGAAPGGWSEFAVKQVGDNGKVIALDILSIDAIAGVDVIQGDFREQAVLDRLMNLVQDSKIDLVISDMAPNMSGNKEVDIPRAMYLCELALDFAKNVLRSEGALVMKVFHGEGFEPLLKDVRQAFKQVVTRKPKASRPRSREAYLVAKAFNSRYHKL
jgi:23S rRNA (uridine2552-2'-O)-methyltransferase